MTYMTVREVAEALLLLPDADLDRLACIEKEGAHYGFVHGQAITEVSTVGIDGWYGSLEDSTVRTVTCIGECAMPLMEFT